MISPILFRTNIYDPIPLTAPTLDETHKNAAVCYAVWFRYERAIKRIKKIRFWFLSKRARQTVNRYEEKARSFERSASGWTAGAYAMITERNLRGEK